MNRGYSRKHLRSPFKAFVLFEDDNFLFKCESLNISEGGLLLRNVPHLPSQEDVTMMISIPRVPIFKNFSQSQLDSFVPGILKKKVIGLKAKMLSRDSETTSIEDIFDSFIGVQFTEIKPVHQKIISEYVDNFLSNIIYLQRLIEESSSFSESKQKVWRLAELLGYHSDIKISELRLAVEQDYQSLKWN